MKIGIITFHNAKNYGASLQAYALRKALNTKFQADAEIINYRPNVIEKTFKIFNFVSPKILLKSIALAPMTIKKYNRFSKFSKLYHNLSKKTYYTEQELKDIENYDVCITGSDQVWNTRVTEGLLDSYTLNFIENPDIIKISYAASIGNSSIEKQYEEEYREKIEKIDAISVREETAKEVLKKVVDKPIDVVLDPTLLLTEKEWNEIATLPNKNKKYILVYCLEENKELNEIVSYMAKKLGLEIVTFAIKNKYGSATTSAYASGPREFLGLFKNAEYIITNSFHGTTFSIIFHKKFYTVPHSARGSRMIDLLNKLDLSDRIVHNKEEIEQKEVNAIIDYRKVDEKITIEREASMEYLRKNIYSKK